MDQSWRALLTFAEDHDGVFTVSDAARLGVVEHRLWHKANLGSLEFVHPNVVRVVGVAPYWLQQARAATLWLGLTAAISFQTAGRLLRLDGEYGSDIHAWVPNECELGRRCRSVVVHRTLFLPDAHRLFVGGIPCTSAARTVVDLAAVLTSLELTVAAESARRLGLMTMVELQRTIEQCGRRRRGSVALRKYVDAHEGNPALDRKLEVKMAALLRSARLGGFRGQYDLRVLDGRRFRVDFAWPEQRLVVECDGFRWHGNHTAWKHDRRRIAAIERAGWRVVTVTWDDVTRHREETIERIRLALHGSPV
jgi:very-short-patch-repair endonuclease